MRITEGQLRRIIREEAQALREASLADQFKSEMSASPKSAGRMSEHDMLMQEIISAMNSGASGEKIFEALFNMTKKFDVKKAKTIQEKVINSLFDMGEPDKGKALQSAFDKAFGWDYFDDWLA